MTSVATPPVDPREDRLYRAIKARADYLAKPVVGYDGAPALPGLDERESARRAVSHLRPFLQANPEAKQSWKDYIDGKVDTPPKGWVPDYSSPEDVRQFRAEGMARARSENPWLAAGTDALNVAGSLGEGFTQGVTDMATGAANLIPGVTVPRVDVKASLRAFALNHVPWLKEQGKTFTTDEARRELDATKDSANALTQVAEMTGQGIGSMYSMIGTGGTGAIGKVSKVTSAPFRGAMKMGDGIGKTLGTLTGKVALAQSAGAVLGSAAGIAADKAIKAGTTQDATTGQERKTTMGERAGQAGVGAAEGALFGLLGEVGKAAFRSMFKTPLSKLGVDEKNAVTTLSEWAKQNHLFQVGRETTEAYSKRLLNAYAEAGFPGAPRMYGRQILGRAMQGGIEGLGFSALDERFHRDLFDGAFQGDTQALKRALIAYGSGVFQTMAMHIPLKDIPRAQRRQDFTPTGEAPKPQEPVKQAAPKPQEPVDPTGGGQQTLVKDPGFAPPRKANNRDKLRRFGWVDVAKARPQEPFKSDYQGGVVGEGLRPPEAPPQQPRESQPYDSAMLGPIKGFDPSMKPEQIEALGRVDAGQVYTERHQNVDYSSIGPGPAPKPDTIDYYKDDSLRQHYAEQSKTFDGDVKIKVGSNAAQQALQFIPQRTKAYKQLKDIAENKASGTVDFTAEEARRFVDYHARSAPRRRTTEDIKVSQPKIKALDSIAEKLLTAYGKPLEPPRAEPTQGPEGPLPSGPIGVKTSGDAPMEAEVRTGPDDGPVEMEIVGTPFDFQIKDGMAWASPKLEDALGLDGPVPEAEFMQAVEGAATMSALVAKEQLPGTVISADGIVAVPDGDGVMRTVRLGEVLESPLSPTPTWVPAESFPARGKDPIPQEQAQVVEILTDIVNNRQDLPEHTRAMLSKAADVMDTVSLHNDEAVAETMDAVADLVPIIAQGTPEQAAKAVQALGESLTVKHPEIALRDMAGPQEPVQKAPPRGDDNPDGYGPAQVGMGIPVPPEVVAGLKTTGRGAKGIAEKGWNWFQQSLMKSAEAAGLGGKLSSIIRKSVTNTRKFISGHSDAGLFDLKRTSPKAQRALGEEILSDKHGGHTTLYYAKTDKDAAGYFGEGRTLTPDEQKVIDTARGTISHGARIAEDLGVKFRNLDGGEERGITYDPNRKIAPRVPTSTMVDATMNRRGPVWDALVKWFGDARGKTVEEVTQEYVNKSSAVSFDPTEHVRFERVIPTRLTVDGKIVKLFEDTPVEHAEKLAWRNAHIMGAISAIPRDAAKKPQDGSPEYRSEVNEALPENAQQILNDIQTEFGKDAAREAEGIIRSLHGMAIRNDPSWAGTPGTDTHTAIKVIGDAFGVMKALALSASSVVNIPEPIANAPLLTLKAITNGYGTILRAFKDKSLGTLHRSLVSEGFLVDSKENIPHGSDGLMEKWDENLQKSKELLMTPMRLLQDANELILASAAKERLEAMQRGEGVDNDLAALKLLGFQANEAMAMIQGKGSAEMYAEYKNRIVSNLTGGKGLHGVEKSMAAHSRGFNAIVWFSNFFQARSRAATAVYERFREAPDYDARKVAAGQLLSFAGFTALSGLLGNVIKKWVLGDDAGDYLHEMVAGGTLGESVTNGISSFAQLVLSGTLGGAGQLISDPLFGPAKEGQSSMRVWAERLGGLVAPLGTVAKGADFIGALRGQDVPGYEGKTGWQALAKYITNVAPLARGLDKGLFGLGVIAITEKDKDLDDAQDSYYRWLFKNAPPEGGDRSELGKEWRDSMRKVVDQVQAGKFYGDDDLMDALVDAQMAHVDRSVSAADRAVELGQKPKPVSVRDAKTAMAASLRARKFFSEQKMSKLTADQVKSLHAHLGEENEQRLKDYDTILEALAKKVAPPRRF